MSGVVRPVIEVVTLSNEESIFGGIFPEVTPGEVNKLPSKWTL